jgi:hypothetical protein
MFLLALFEVAIALSYRKWGQFPKRTTKRLVPWFFSMLAVSAIPLMQLQIYSKATLEPWNQLDGFATAIVVLESGICLVLLLYFTSRHRTKT